jgi:hypothetical protein
VTIDGDQVVCGGKMWCCLCTSSNVKIGIDSYKYCDTGVIIGRWLARGTSNDKHNHRLRCGEELILSAKINLQNQMNGGMICTGPINIVRAPLMWIITLVVN